MSPLKRYMIKHRLSTTSLAKLSNVPQPTICRIANCKGTARYENAVKIAKALGFAVSVEQIQSGKTTIR